jgi:hypothetical protein
VLELDVETVQYVQVVQAVLRGRLCTRLNGLNWLNILNVEDPVFYPLSLSAVLIDNPALIPYKLFTTVT